MQTTSPVTYSLDEPTNDEQICRSTLSYIAETTRDELYDLVIRSCIETGITQAKIAKRLGKDPAHVNRLLKNPGNWTIDTIAELLYAIDGRMLKIASFWPLREKQVNDRVPTCFTNIKITLTTADTIAKVTINNAQPRTFVGAYH